MTEPEKSPGDKSFKHRVVVIDRHGHKHEIGFAEIQGSQVSIVMSESTANELHHILLTEDIDQYVVELPEGDRPFSFHPRMGNSIPTFSRGLLFLANRPADKKEQ